MWQCPSCGSRNLLVVVEEWKRLIQSPDDPDDFQTTDCSRGDHEWGPNSLMECKDCGTQEISDEFDLDRDQEEIKAELERD